MSRKRPYKRGPLPPLVTTKTEAPVAPAVIIPSEPEWAATNSLDRQIAQARREMGAARWKQLMAEWD